MYGGALVCVGYACVRSKCCECCGSKRHTYEINLTRTSVSVYKGVHNNNLVTRFVYDFTLLHFFVICVRLHDMLDMQGKFSFRTGGVIKINFLRSESILLDLSTTIYKKVFKIFNCLAFSVKNKIN